MGDDEPFGRRAGPGLEPRQQHRHPGTTFSAVGGALAVDAQGNQYVAGFFQNPPTLSLGSFVLTNVNAAATTSDTYVAKYDPAGALVWAFRFGGLNSESPTGVAVDGAGNVYVAAWFRISTVIGSTTLTSAGGIDVMLFKLNAQGVAQWAVRAGGPLDDVDRPNDVGYPVAAVSAGGTGPVWLGASFQGTATLGSGPATLGSAGGFDQLVLGLDAGTGAVVRAARLGGPDGDYLSRLALDGSSNLYAAGLFYSPTLAAGSTTLTRRRNDSDSYLVKYDPQLTVQWAAAEGGPGPGTGVDLFGLSVSPAGVATIAGSCTGTIPVGSAGTIAGVAGAARGYLISYSAAGQATALSAGTITGSNGSLNGLAADPAGNFYVCGYFTGTLTWGSIALTGSTLSNAVVLKLDAALMPQWAARPTPGPGTQSFPLDVATDPAGNCYVTGQYSGGTLQFGALPPLPAGGLLGFVARLGNAPLATRSAQRLLAAPLGAWPNPVAAGQLLHLPPAPLPGAATLRLSDGLGRLVSTLPVLAPGPEVRLSATLPAGRYVAEVVTAGQVLRQALLVE